MPLTIRSRNLSFTIRSATLATRMRSGSLIVMTRLRRGNIHALIENLKGFARRLTDEGVVEPLNTPRRIRISASVAPPAPSNNLLERQTIAPEAIAALLAAHVSVPAALDESSLLLRWFVRVPKPGSSQRLVCHPLWPFETSPRFSLPLRYRTSNVPSCLD